MFPSPPSGRRRPRRAVLLLVLAAVVVLAGACTGVQRPVRGYGAEAEANFVRACTDDLQIVDGERVNTPLAPESYCKCVYETMKDVYSLPWEDLAAYEKEQADAPDGEAPPLPDEVTKSMDDCSRSTVRGPTTTEGETTTTAG